MNDAGHLPPHAPDVEQAVLGACMIEPRNALPLVAAFLKPEHFYVNENLLTYAAIMSLYEASEEVDILTVLERRIKLERLDGEQKGEKAFFLSQLTNKVASSAHVQYHARIIVQYFVQREVIRLSVDRMREGYDPSTDAIDLAERATRTFSEVLEKVLFRSGSSIGEVAEEELARMDEPQRRHVTTGFNKLDDALGGGWSPGDLVLVAARPGMGKTSFATSSCYLSAARGVRCGLFSLELGQMKTNARLQSFGTSVPLSRILAPAALSTDEMTTIQNHHAAYSKLPIEVNFNNGISMAELKAEVHRWVRERGVEVVYVDQLSWITTRARDPVERVGEITRGIKRMAVELNIPIVLLHQLSRAVAQRDNKRPILTDLRDSGHAEQDAQVVIFAHRDDYYGVAEGADWDGAVDLIVAKNSNGPVGDVRMYFDAPCTAVREHRPQPFP